MDVPFTRLSAVHQFLVRRSLYALVVSSLLAISILAGRIYMSESPGYRFLIWNLFLAWIPYLASLWAAFTYQLEPKAWWRLLLPGALWLVFFPNAPYIITDFVHLNHTSFVWWYDVGMLATFAWTGCSLAVASLDSMQTLVVRYLGTIASWLFVIGVVVLSGFGVYLGRFERWNSWDLLFQPRLLMADVVPRVTDPLNHPQPLGVTCLFGAFLFVCYLTFRSAKAH